MAQNFEGKLVLVTGGSSGIGLELARLLAGEGARVWLLARRPDFLAQALQSLPVLNGHAHGTVEADVTKADQVRAAVGRVSRDVGVPDVIVNAAGSSHPAYVQDTTLDIFREMMDLNYFGIVNMVQAVLPGMLRRGSGYIVNFSSMAGFMAPFGYTAYVPSKYAVRGFSDSLRLELKPMGIRVSVVFPPDTDTPGMENENKTKPYETLEAFSSKLAPATAVAKGVLAGMKRGRYAILPGFEPALYYRLVGLLGNAVYPLMDSVLAQARRKKARA
jgi:3-dehydrosphinganine reductase